MRRFVASALLGIFLVGLLGGCDLTSLGDLGDASKAIISERGATATADMTMDQVRLQTRDQLKDGSCLVGKQAGNGEGQGEVLRLRDGSCQ